MSERHENIYKSRKAIFVNNFIGGIAWGIGVTIGLGLLLATLAFIGKNVNLVPVVGDFVAQVINYILSNSAQIPGK